MTGRLARRGAGRRGGFAGALLLAGGLAVTGCGSAPELADDVAAGLRTQVVTVAAAAGDGRYADAAAGLRQLRDALDAAAEAGDVSAARYRTIADALDRTELELAAAEAAQAAAVQAAAEQAAAEQAAAEQAAAEAAAAQQAAADQAAEQEAAAQAAAAQAAAEQAAADAAGPPGGNGNQNGKPDGPGPGRGHGKDD